MIRLGSSGVALAVIFVACTGCRPDTTDSATNRSVGALRDRKSTLTRPKNVYHRIGATAEALRFPDPGEGPWKKWLTYSESEDSEEKYKSYRIPGESFSRYYDVESDMSQGDQNTGILDDKGKYLNTSFYRYSDYIGIRKTPSKIFVFAYYLPDDDSVGSYDIAEIKDGNVLMLRCTVSKNTLENVAAEPLTTKVRFSAARFEYAPGIVNLLTSSDPDLKRDKCG